MSKNLEISALCDIYGALLPQKQRDALELYYNEDLSLAEIAEQVGISRQGVRDQIKHAENQLLTYEAALGLFKKIQLTEELLAQVQIVSEKSDTKDELLILLSKLRKVNE